MSTDMKKWLNLFESEEMAAARSLSSNPRYTTRHVAEDEELDTNVDLDAQELPSDDRVEQGSSSALASSDEFSIEPMDEDSPYIVLLDGEQTVRVTMELSIFQDLARQVLGITGDDSDVEPEGDYG